jgi:hypothetical protein
MLVAVSKELICVRLVGALLTGIELMVLPVTLAQYSLVILPVPLQAVVPLLTVIEAAAELADAPLLSMALAVKE